MLTKEQRNKLDADVLAATSRRNGNATYVLRNHLDWPDEPWHRTGLSTADVLRSCRRLERLGLVEEARRSHYAVMKCWQITDAGRAALSSKGES